jgi:peptidoglycan/xylan/chitin deacetylase (PgdA/CDA1 family)
MIMKFELPPIALCYHRVGLESKGSQSLLSTSPANFEGHLLWLRSLGYKFVQVSDPVFGSVATCAITFDDGYQDNLTQALPILEKLRIPATVFISTDYIKQASPFPPDIICKNSTSRVPSKTERWAADRAHFDAISKLAAMDKPTFTSEYNRLVEEAVYVQCSDGAPLTVVQLLELSAHQLIEIGPHTNTHRSLTSIPREELLDELSGPLNYFQSLGITSSPYYAIPFGQGVDANVYVSSVIRGLGFEPLTTYPLTLNANSCGELRLGIPRLSVGPWNLDTFKRNFKMMRIGSLVSPLWICLLGIRRGLIKMLRGAMSFWLAKKLVS